MPRPRVRTERLPAPWAASLTRLFTPQRFLEVLALDPDEWYDAARRAMRGEPLTVEEEAELGPRVERWAERWLDGGADALGHPRFPLLPPRSDEDDEPDETPTREDDVAETTSEDAGEVIEASATIRARSGPPEGRVASAREVVEDATRQGFLVLDPIVREWRDKPDVARVEPPTPDEAVELSYGTPWSASEVEEAFR